MRRCTGALFLALLFLASPGAQAEPLVCDWPGSISVSTQNDCSVSGNGQDLLLVGTVLSREGVIKNGQVLIQNDKISCVGCECAAHSGSSTIIACSNGVISPGLINSHDHLTYSNDVPHHFSKPDYLAGKRYNHRHDWRTGKRGYSKIKIRKNPAKREDLAWAEIRALMAGTTSSSSAGYHKGLIRNIDSVLGSEGLLSERVFAPTFPLGDSRGDLKTLDCSYAATAQPGSQGWRKLKQAAESTSFSPHLSEGLDEFARNEFLCLTNLHADGFPVIGSNTSLIHAIGLKAADYRYLANAGAGIIWSPRSNISLYGNTLPLPLMKSLGIPLSLGTDWIQSGSMNVLRELACASSLNDIHFGSAYSHRDLWEMVTSNPSKTFSVDDEIGAIKEGLFADLTIFSSQSDDPYRAVVEARPENVLLTMRAGRLLYGDQSILDPADAYCDAIDVCGKSKSLCLRDDIGKSYSEIAAALTNPYPLFFCDTPKTEPSCTPARHSDHVDYSGVISAHDLDGDGIGPGEDNCPLIFNPPTPINNNQQADWDLDGEGDVCDSCPFGNRDGSCSNMRTDFDGDNISDERDNCPLHRNPDQNDFDGDSIGDICDICPNDSNPKDGGCPTSIAKLKVNRTNYLEKISIPKAYVSHVSPQGFYAQDIQKPTKLDTHGGIFFYTGARDHLPVVGDEIQVIRARVLNFFKQTQLSLPKWEILNSKQLPGSISLSSAEVAGTTTKPLLNKSPYEGMLVSIVAPIISAVAPITNTNLIQLELDGLISVPTPASYFGDTPTVGTRLMSVTGVLAWQYGQLTLLTKSHQDFFWSNLSDSW